MSSLGARAHIIISRTAKCWRQVGSLTLAAAVVSGALAGTALAAGGPTVTITPHSGVVSGNIGTETSEVSVNVSLQRAGTTVDTAAETTTNEAGEWTATLPSHMLSDQSDTVVVAYSGTGAPTPSSSAYTNVTQLEAAAAIGADGKTITINCQEVGGECGAKVPVTVHYGTGGTSELLAEPDISGNYRATLSPAVTANDTVAFQPTYEYGNGSNVSLVLTAGLPGVGVLDATGFPAPTCSVNLVNVTVSCRDVQSGASYTVQQVRSGVPIATKTLKASTAEEAGAPGSFSGEFPGIAAGDEVRLIVPAAGEEPTRTVTTLHVYTVRADIIDQGSHLEAGSAAGSCKAGELDITDFLACSSLGTFSSSNASHVPVFEDELSGGETSVAVPTFNAESPSDNQLVPQSFVAYADVVNFGEFDTSTPVSVSATPLGGGAPQSFAGNANSGSGASVSSLAEVVP